MTNSNPNPARDIWSRKTPPSKNVNAFIKASPKEAQPKLKQLRDIIRESIPGAEEVISYRMPVYKLKGIGVAGFAGYKYHVGFYPMSGSFFANYKKMLERYETSKGAVRFPIDKPLPVLLIKRLLKARVKQSEHSGK